jgi:hypothetical protein
MPSIVGPVPVNGTHPDIVQVAKKFTSASIPVISTNLQIQYVEITSTIRPDNSKPKFRTLRIE